MGSPPPASTPMPPAAPTPRVVEAVPLELTGTIPGPDPKNGLAIVAGPEGQVSFHVGDELPGGVRLVAVDPRGVALEREGRTERLDLPSPTLEPAAQAVVPQTLTAPPRPAPAAAGAATPTPGLLRDDKGNLRLARDRLRELRKQQEQRRVDAKKD